MLDPVVQSAFVVIVAWLLALGAHAINLPLDDKTLFALAGALVAYLLSVFGVNSYRSVRSYFMARKSK